MSVFFTRRGGSPKVYDSVFANNTWEQVIRMCHMGKVPDTWNVGDQLTMKIGGTNYLIDIIGKNHDDYTDGSGKAPLTFQLHDLYGTKYAMNTSDTTTGGWDACDMRTTHLPSILALMPTEVQTAIREVNKNCAGYSDSKDKLFLLSETETFGAVKNSSASEGTQYDYYKEGNSKVKSYNGTNTIWWNRSTYKGNEYNFCTVSVSGDQNYNSADTAYGVSFAFCF